LRRAWLSRREEVVEVAVALVPPVKLHRAPQEHAVLVHDLGLLLEREEHMERGGLPGQLERRGDQAAPLGRTGGEDPAAADGGEGNS
jgi:hypothetical protein